MRRPEESQLRELMFRVSEFLKGFDGALETVGGIALWVVSPGLIVRAVGLLKILTMSLPITFAMLQAISRF